MTTVFLELRNLQKVFRVGLLARKVTAVRDVSLSLRRGESMGFLGPNGSGKTTSIKCILGLIRPTAGSVKLFGRDPWDIEARAGVGYLPESPYFYDWLTPREVMNYAGDLFGLDRTTRRTRTGALLERLGLGHAADRPLRGFSKGMLQRLGIAQSLLNDPELVIYDEPLSGLDPIGRKEVLDLMAELRSQGKSLFFSSHVLTDIETLCDAVTILNQGKVVAAGRLDALLDRGALEVEALFELGAGGEAAARALLAVEGSVERERTGARLRLAVPHDAVDALLQAGLAAGAKLEQLLPRRDSLEELFVRKAVRVEARGESQDSQDAAAKGQP
ncbi:MAG: ABC transporter ATP-binding protein [Myxococcales bacterium]|nr:ABC transporter ATP-binding protein [Myxococcales bacterium]